VFRALSKIFVGLAIFFLSLGMAFSLTGSLSHVEVLAQTGGCTGLKRKIRVTDIIRPTSFVPLIPANCSQDANGPVPLSLAVLPDILARGFGLICSLGFYLFGFIVLFSGLQWIYGGIVEEEVLRAKRNLQDSVIGLVLIFSTYVIINTLLSVLGANNILNTDFNSFFTFY
jgi:hypothetical protein